MGGPSLVQTEKVCIVRIYRWKWNWLKVPASDYHLGPAVLITLSDATLSSRASTFTVFLPWCQRGIDPLCSVASPGSHALGTRQPFCALPLTCRDGCPSVVWICRCVLPPLFSQQCWIQAVTELAPKTGLYFNFSGTQNIFRVLVLWLFF